MLKSPIKIDFHSHLSSKHQAGFLWKNSKTFSRESFIHLGCFDDTLIGFAPYIPITDRASKYYTFLAFNFILVITMGQISSINNYFNANSICGNRFVCFSCAIKTLKNGKSLVISFSITHHRYSKSYFSITTGFNSSIKTSIVSAVLVGHCYSF